MLRIFTVLFGAAAVLFIAGVLSVTYLLWRMSDDLPDYDHLADYAPPIMTRMHAGDGQLIAEYAKERRMFVPIEAIPERVTYSFMAAEDKNFYEHQGLYFKGILRAIVANIGNLIQDRRMEGASTITQQVAKNFLLTNERSLERKIKEALLSLKLERAFTKAQILELYLNQIYLGMGSYGVAAAALIYFDKPLDQLTIAESAYLAALPKAPSRYHPYRNRERALARRNWVIGRMEENGFITAYEASVARAEDLVVTPRRQGAQVVDANYFVEEVRRELYGQYGETKLYEGGMSVRTTLDTGLQTKAAKALRDGLVAYDRRHGWRGPVSRLESGENWQEALSEMKLAEDLAPWTFAAVIGLEKDRVKIGVRPEKEISGEVVEDVVIGYIPLSEMEWAREFLSTKSRGAKIKEASDVLAIGDVVYVEPLSKQEDEPGTYTLRQIPQVNGGIVAMDPYTGRVLAMVGGMSFQTSQFNRAVQAKRQPGSAFKPFVYAAALDKGFTPSSLILDAPFVMDQGPGLALWKPENYGHRFYGPSTLRLGIEKSRNVMTVRLAQNVGMRKISDYAKRFGIMDKMPAVLSMSLGAGETTLMRMTAAYAMLVNGGKKVTPTLVDRIQDRRGKTIFRHDTRECIGCRVDMWDNQEMPKLPDTREQVLSAQTAYQVVSMLEGVVQRGTGRTISKLGRPLAGKTGTTNDERDAWFMGFSPNMVVGVFVGLDEPRPMGKGETGGKVAAPIFKQFMADALGDQPAIPFRIPNGMNLVRVHAKTGLLAQPGDDNVILEAFKEGTGPRAPEAPITYDEPIAANENGDPLAQPTRRRTPTSLSSGTGGLY